MSLALKINKLQNIVHQSQHCTVCKSYYFFRGQKLFCRYYEHDNSDYEDGLCL